MALIKNVIVESVLKIRYKLNLSTYEELTASTKTRFYFVLELVIGGEPFAKVTEGRFRVDLRCGLFQQCGSRGVFHRDLVPEIRLGSENGGLKVSDLLLTLWGTPVTQEILTYRGYDGAKIDDLYMPEIRRVTGACVWSHKWSDLLVSPLSDLDASRSKDEGRSDSSIFGCGVVEPIFSIF